MKNRTAGFLLVVASLMLCASYAPAQGISEGTRKVVTKVLPQIPNLARSLHLQGNVRADVLVAANGKVKSVEVKGGHPLLGQAAQNALSQWTWEPAGHETHETVELRFNP